MHSEIKTCQNCKKDFTIEVEDFNFYEKIKVPPPTWCPECRMNRRMSFGNTWGVYFRNCDKCGEKTLTMYRPENPIRVYCDSCWWADDWDGSEYGVDYDPNRNFLEQWRELRSKTPHFAKDALYTTLKNCEYTNAIAFSKNCYMSFWVDYCDFVFYSSLVNNVKDSVDVFRVFRSELCYDSVGINSSSKIYFSSECDNCVDVWFSRNCYGCNNCFGCVNQHGKSYLIFNKQYSKEEYFNKLKEFQIETRSGINKARERAMDFWHELPYREYTGNSMNLNVTGDYIYGSKNAKNCYLCNGVEDSKYVQFVSVPRVDNCFDYYGWGNGASLVYECAISGEGIQSLKFSFGMFSNGLDSEYCGFCIGTKNNFGCSNLKRKQYAILNKVYPKEEYLKLKEKIIEDMNKNPYIDNNGRIYKYGEFFPPEFSMFPYEDSTANRFFEKTKEEALKEGYNWEDKHENHYKKTINLNEVPETIKNTTESILKEVIGCVSCGRGYKITQGELSLYKKLNVPVPDKCPRCRDVARFSLMNKPKYFKTQCDKCGKEITTMHNPESKKIIYCEKCYQKEVY